MTKAFAGLFLFLLLSVAFGQRPKTLYTQLNEENGLAQNFVYGIVKGKRGFVWISTGDGLTRYDGKSTRVFTTSDGLANNFITASYLASSGRVLFGHFQGSVSTYNGAYFESILNDTLKSEIVSFSESTGHVVFAATRSKGLIAWDQDLSSPALLFPAELQGKIVNQIKVVGSQLITATNEGVYTFQIDGKNLIFNDAPESLLYEDITAIETFKSDSLRCWVSTSGKGIFIIRPGTFTRVVQHLYSSIFENIDIRSIVNDSEHSLWLGTHQRGLFHLTLEKDTVINHIDHFDEASGYPIFSVNSLFIETDGIAWVGTLSNGLVKLHDPFFRFFDASSVGIKKVNDVAEGINSYYVATDQGLFTLNTDVNASSPFQATTLLKHEPILSLRIIGDDLWIGTQNNGIQIYNQRNHQLKKLNVLGMDGRLVKVRLFETDKNGDIWISAMGSGAIQIEKNGKVLKHLSTTNGFIHNDIFAIHPDAKGNVWFGSLGAGLAMMDAKGEIHRLSQEDKFPSHDINDITEHNGVIWIATDGQGYFKQTENTFTKVGPSQESESPFVKSLKADKDNKIWIATRRSVGYIDLSTEKSRYYDKNDGLLEKEDYASPIYIDSKGNLLLANERGVTMFNTSTVGRPVVLDTYLSDLAISFNSYLPPTPTNEEILAGTYPSVILNHDQNHLTFDFRAVNTNFTGRTYYRYYLDDLEEKWSPASTVSTVTYTSLEPGTYTLHAQATNDLRAWTDKPLTYVFTIEKPYWNKAWFYLIQMLGIVTLFGTTYLLIRSPVAKRSLGRVMVFMCVFILFDYLQNWLEPITPDFIGSVPLYKTLLNLSLAMILFPLERGIKNFFKKQERGRDLV